MKICAIVVTHNRKLLLAECLEAIKAQSLSPHSIIIVDNASTDGTPNLLLDLGYIANFPNDKFDDSFLDISKVEVNGYFVNIYYLRLNKNVGGAGGFYEGIKKAYEINQDWFWLLDDDAIPDQNALFNLFNKICDLKDLNVGFLSSKVLWLDGTPHLMNLPGLKPVINKIPFNCYEDKGILLINSSSFVSLLISRETVSKIGLPIKEYFIWNDDFEYTWRITNSGYVGLYVKDSIVVHKTKTNYFSEGIYDWRFYYNVRNFLWTYKLHDKKKYFFYFLYHILMTFKTPFSFKLVNLRACLASLFKTPKIEFLR